MIISIKNHIVTILSVLLTVIFWVPLNRAVLAWFVPVVSMVPDGSWTVQAAMFLAVAVLYANVWPRLRDESTAMPVRRWGLLALILMHIAGRLSGYYIFYGVNNCTLCYLDICYIGIIMAETVAFIQNRVRRRKHAQSAAQHLYFPFYPEQPSSDNILDRNRLADILTDKILTSYANGAFSGGSFSILLNEEFGAGKTSFFNLLKGVSAKKNISCLEFLPWLSDSDKGLVERFFLLLENHVKMSGDYYLLSLLRSYSSSVSEASGSSLINRLFHLVFHRNPIEQTYNEIFSRLKHSGSPLIILVDDVDRLNAEELRSLLKLLRNTANFPNLVFIIAADGLLMENMLRNSGIDAPGEFLKKFFNIEFLFPALDNEIVPELKSRIIDILDFYFPEKRNAMAADHVFMNPYMKVEFHNFRNACRFLNLLSFSLDSLKRTDLLNDICVSDLINISLIQFADSHIFRVLRDDHSVLLELDGIPGTGRLKIRSSVDSLLMDSHTREILDIVMKKEEESSAWAKGKADTGQQVRSLQECHDGIRRFQPSAIDFIAWIFRDLFNSANAELNSIQYINEYFKYFAGKYRRNELSDSEMELLMSGPDTDFMKRAELLSNDGKDDFLFHKICVYSQNTEYQDCVNIIRKVLILFEVHYALKSSRWHDFITRSLTWRNSYFAYSTSHLLYRQGQKPDIGQTAGLEAFFRSDSRFTELALILDGFKVRHDGHEIVGAETLKVWSRILINRFVSEVLVPGPFKEDNIDTMVCLEEIDPEYWAQNFREYMQSPETAMSWLNEMFVRKEDCVYELKARYMIYFEHCFIPEWLSNAIQTNINCTLVYKTGGCQ